MEYWENMTDLFDRDEYEFFYCKHCNKVYYIDECTHEIDDQRDSVNYYREDLTCNHCGKDVECLFTDEEDLKEWLEEMINNDDELPLNITVEKEKDHYEEDEYVKLTNWYWKK